MKNKQIIAGSIFVLALLTSSIVHAVAVGYTSEVDRGDDNGMYGMYSAVVHWSWPEQRDTSRVCGHLPATGCFLSLGPTTPLSRGGTIPTSGPYVSLNYTDTAVDAHRKWVEKYGPTGSLLTYPWPRGIRGTECTGFRIFERKGSGGTIQTVDSMLQFSICGGTPPFATTCNELTSMTFDFGNVTVGNNVRRQRSISQTLSCTRASTATLRLISPLRLSSNLTATMTVNSKVLDASGASIPLSSGRAQLDFVATLEGNEKTVGVYTASSVLLLEFQ
ncbi:hypothetical protein QQ39_16300 [Pragia fontium]|nr:hypothetical protein QQ39_16300 [Pragia fontium]